MAGLEITNNIGCPNNCLKYCPQEVLLKRYSNQVKMMSMQTFKAILNNTPRSVTINFSGFSDPSVNPDWVNMIKHAIQRGHEVKLFTTLCGASDDDVEELKHIKFQFFCLHLPDGKILKEPKTSNYRNHIFELQTQVSNLTLMSMNDNFKSYNRELAVRRLVQKKRRYGYCTQGKFKNVEPVVLPNGYVYLCCMDFGLNSFIGNLLKENYRIIHDRIVKNEGKFSECYFCSWNQPYFKYLFWLSWQSLKKSTHIDNFSSF